MHDIASDDIGPRPTRYYSGHTNITRLLLLKYNVYYNNVHVHV